MIDKSSSIRDIQVHFGSIYNSANQDFSIDAMFVRLSESAARLFSSVGQEEGKPDDFLKIISWLFAIANKMEIDVQTAMISRYPGVCPKCVSSICTCLRTSKLPVGHLYDIQEELEGRAETLLNQHNLNPADPKYFFTLNWAADNLERIYPNNMARWSVNRYFFPATMLRELGKVIQGYRRIQYAPLHVNQDHIKRSFAGDCADFLAWLLAFWTLSCGREPRSLPQAQVVAKYSFSCPYCASIPCECSRTRRLGNGAETVTEPTQLREMVKTEVDRVIEELTKADSGTSLVKQLEKIDSFESPKTLSKVLDKIRTTVSGGSDFAGNAEKIISSISRIMEIVSRVT